MVKVTYLDHSGYMVELDRYILVFDYYRGEEPRLNPEKKILVFSSHAHFDHFHKKIFTWEERCQKIQYILSDDIPQNRRMPEIKSPVTFLGPDAQTEVWGIQIRTLRSTDEGVAFLVNVDGISIYHAGDLNWWHWKEEDDEEWNIPMRKAYQAEIAKLRGEVFDLAFVPLDARLQEAYAWGLDYFVRHVSVRYVFPMHMQTYEACERLFEDPCSEEYRKKLMRVEKPGQVFDMTFLEQRVNEC